MNKPLFILSAFIFFVLSILAWRVGGCVMLQFFAIAVLLFIEAVRE